MTMKDRAPVLSVTCNKMSKAAIRRMRPFLDFCRRICARKRRGETKTTKSEGGMCTIKSCRCLKQS